jgi:hypothetical protein
MGGVKLKIPEDLIDTAQEIITQIENNLLFDEEGL